MRMMGDIMYIFICFIYIHYFIRYMSIVDQQTQKGYLKRGERARLQKNIFF